MLSYKNDYSILYIWGWGVFGTVVKVPFGHVQAMLEYWAQVSLLI